MVFHSEQRWKGETCLGDLDPHPPSAGAMASASPLRAVSAAAGAGAARHGVRVGVRVRAHWWRSCVRAGPHSQRRALMPVAAGPAGAGSTRRWARLVEPCCPSAGPAGQQGTPSVTSGTSTRLVTHPTSHLERGSLHLATPGDRVGDRNREPQAA